MQLTGQTGTHLRQPLHSSGTMTTSMPWLKMAPNCGGQWRRHASQLMHSDISMRSGGFRHFGLRECVSMRWSRDVVATAETLVAAGAASSTAPPRVHYAATPQALGGASRRRAG